MGKKEFENRQEVVAAINDLAKSNKGKVTPLEVVSAAKDPNSALHSLFEWDDAKAGDAYRLDQAREIIRSIKYEFKIEKTSYKAVAYVRDPRCEPFEQGYVHVATVRKDEDMARDILIDSFVRARAALERGRVHAKLFGLSDDFDAMIERLEIMRGRLGPDEDRPLAS